MAAMAAYFAVPGSRNMWLAASAEEGEVQQETRSAVEHPRSLLQRRTWRVVLGGTAGLAMVLALTGGTVFAATRRAPPPTAPRHASSPVTPNRLYSVMAQGMTCKHYMRFVGCNSDILWRCDEDDGSAAFQCCCGYGVYPEAIAPIRWSAHPAKCLHVGALPKRSEDELYEDDAELSVRNDTHGTGRLIQLWDCTAGLPDKRFDMTVSDEGAIRWDMHPEMCLDVEDCGEGEGSSAVRLMPCDEGCTYKRFKLPKGGSGQIRWAAYPDKCLHVEDGAAGNGADIRLRRCERHSPKQLFDVTPKPDPQDTPSLFCVSVMMPHGYEVDMLRSQLARGLVGIFACNVWAVYTNETIRLSPGPPYPLFTEVVPGSLVAPIGGKFNTSMNTDIFIRFWHKVVHDLRAQTNDWTVKVDPDTVFFPERLRALVRFRWPGKPKAAYLNNCYLGMHGPIEVLSLEAIKIYARQSHHCVHGEPHEHGQEDVFLRHCLDLLGIEKVDAFNILLEGSWACNERPSSQDYTPHCYSKQVSFHPFKSVEGWLRCHDRAAKQDWAVPWSPQVARPTHANQHHA